MPIILGGLPSETGTRQVVPLLPATTNTRLLPSLLSLIVSGSFAPMPLAAEAMLLIKPASFTLDELDAMVGSFAIANGLATSNAIALVRISFFMMYVPFGGVVRTMYSKLSILGNFLHRYTFARLA